MPIYNALQTRGGVPICKRWQALCMTCGDVPILHGSLSCCLFITRCKREGGGRVRGSSFNACKAEFPAPWHGPSQNAQTNLRPSTPRCRPRSHASKSSARGGVRLIVAKDAVDAHAVANAQEARYGGQCASPREAATKAIAGPASPHVAASTSLAMLRIVPPPRIAPLPSSRTGGGEGRSGGGGDRAWA